MSVTEYERNQLFAWFEEHMGKDRAATMMSLLLPAGWADVATKRDLEVMAERIEARLGARIDRFTSDLHELRSDLQRTFVTWIFAAQSAVIASLGLLIAFTR
jgi:hypothetical protein